MIEAPVYNDGYDDSKDVQFAQNVVSAVEKNGPCVAERIECHHCGCIQVLVHPFVESLACIDCGKRNPSAVPLYLEHWCQDGPL